MAIGGLGVLFSARQSRAQSCATYLRVMLFCFFQAALGAGWAHAGAGPGVEHNVMSAYRIKKKRPRTPPPEEAPSITEESPAASVRRVWASTATAHQSRSHRRCRAHRHQRMQPPPLETRLRRSARARRRLAAAAAPAAALLRAGRAARFPRGGGRAQRAVRRCTGSAPSRRPSKRSSARRSRRQIGASCSPAAQRARTALFRTSTPSTPHVPPPRSLSQVDGVGRAAGVRRVGGGAVDRPDKHAAVLRAARAAPVCSLPQVPDGWPRSHRGAGAAQG